MVMPEVLLFELYIGLTQGWQNAGKYEYFPCRWHLPVNTGIYWKIPANTGKLNLPHWN